MTNTWCRFNYQYNDMKYGAIYKSIEALDRMGMDIIETGDAEVFTQYLQQFENTICGRHPISVFLHVCTILLKKSQCHHSLKIYPFSSLITYSHSSHPWCADAEELPKEHKHQFYVLRTVQSVQKHAWQQCKLCFCSRQIR